MAETYIRLSDALKKKQFAYDLKQYAVTEKDIRAADKVEIVPDENVSELEKAVKVLANRCATLTRGEMCIFCGIRGICDKYRTVWRRDNG
jgi:hypothetical protein